MNLDRRRRVLLGLAAIAAYLVHAGYFVLQGYTEGGMWACHLGALLVGAGLLWRSPHLNAIGTMWLVVGTPLWIVGLVGGGPFLWTSTLTHVGGPLVGAVGIAALGMPRGAWWRALAGLAVLHVVARAAVPAEENVNFAHRIWEGWEGTFPSHGVFLAAVGAACAAVFWALELAAQRAGLRSPAENPPGPGRKTRPGRLS